MKNIIKKLVVVSILVCKLIFFLQIIYANSHIEIENLHIQLNISNEKVVTEKILFELSEPINESIRYTLGSQPSSIDIKVNGNQSDTNYTLMTGDGTSLLLSPHAETDNFTLLLTYDNIIYTQDDYELFFMEYNFAFPVEKYHVELNLPSGKIVTKDNIRPIDGQFIVNDKDSMQIIWDGENSDSLLIFSAKYEDSSVDYWFFSAILFILLMLFFILVFYLLRKNSDSFVLGFKEDELRVIEFLKKRRIILQKEIEKEFGFSRAKGTRIVKKLEENNLIEKEEFGRTNKIRWLG